MDNPEILATFGSTKHRTKTNKAQQHNKAQKTKKDEQHEPRI